MLHTVPKCFCFGRDEAPPHHLHNIAAKTTQLSWFCWVLWSWRPNMCVTDTTVSLSTIKKWISSPVSGIRSGFHSAVSLDLRTFTGLLSFGQICWLDHDRFGSCWGDYGLCTSASLTGCSYWCRLSSTPLGLKGLKVPVNGNSSVTGRWINMKLIWALR